MALHLTVDTEVLTSRGYELINSAETIPLAPAPFTATGTDAISLSILGQATALESPIITGLPEVKAAATKTAGDFITAAESYRETDSRMAQFITDLVRGKPERPGGSAAASGGPGPAETMAPAGSTGASAVGSAGGGTGPQSDSTSSMGQMMSMTGQAAQIPMQMMSAAASVPQGVVQGAQSAVEQITSMTEGMGGDDDKPGGDADKLGDADKPAEQGAAAAQTAAERAPVDDKGDALETRTPGTSPVSTAESTERMS